MMYTRCGRQSLYKAKLSQLVESCQQWLNDLLQDTYYMWLVLFTATTLADGLESPGKTEYCCASHAPKSATSSQACGVTAR